MAACPLSIVSPTTVTINVGIWQRLTYRTSVATSRCQTLPVGVFSWNLPGAKVIPAGPADEVSRWWGGGKGKEGSLGTELALGGQVGYIIHLERVALRGQYLLGRRGGAHVACFGLHPLPSFLFSRFVVKSSANPVVVKELIGHTQFTRNLIGWNSVVYVHSLGW
jgi:hypothetical protein